MSKKVLPFLFLLIAFVECQFAVWVYVMNISVARAIVSLAMLYAFFQLHISSKRLASYPISVSIFEMPAFWRWQFFWTPVIYWGAQIFIDSVVSLIQKFFR